MRSVAGIDPAALLKRARARVGISQRDLAAHAGTSQSVVARIELGETSPTVGTLNRLLEAAGLRPVVTLRAMPTTVRDRDPVELVHRLEAFFDIGSGSGIASAYLFGSAVRGELHRESDIDVGILLDRCQYRTRANRSEARVRLTSALVTALGTNEVDLVILNDVPPGLARAVVSDGLRVACSDPASDHAFVRDSLLRAADLDPFLRRTRAVKLEALRR